MVDGQLNLFWIGYQKMDLRHGPGRPIHTWKRTILKDLKLDNTYEYDELYTKDRDDWSYC